MLGRKKYRYALCTYYIPKQPNVCEAHITVTPNLKVNLTPAFPLHGHVRVNLGLSIFGKSIHGGLADLPSSR
jgi:hypothetical protein